MPRWQSFTCSIGICNLEGPQGTRQGERHAGGTWASVWWDLIANYISCSFWCQVTIDNIVFFGDGDSHGPWILHVSSPSFLHINDIDVYIYILYTLLHQPSDKAPRHKLTCAKCTSPAMPSSFKRPSCLAYCSRIRPKVRYWHLLYWALACMCPHQSPSTPSTSTITTTTIIIIIIIIIL